LKRHNRLDAVNQWVQWEPGFGGRRILDFQDLAGNSHSKLFHSRQGARKYFAGHSELGGDLFLAVCQRHAGCTIFALEWRHKIAADSFLRATKSQVLRRANLASELCGETAEHGTTERVIARHGLPKSLRTDEEKARLFKDAGSH